MTCFFNNYYGYNHVKIKKIDIPQNEDMIGVKIYKALNFGL